MSELRPIAPPGTPGYTGIYRWNGDMLMAMRPDGTWAPMRRYDEFPARIAKVVS